MDLIKMLGGFVQKGRNAVVRNSPKLCAAIAVIGVGTTAVLAVKETPKALRLIEERKAGTKKEKINAAWRCYIPAAASGVITIAAIITGHSIHLQRYGELAVAYGFSQSMLRLYSEKVRKEYGEQREAELRAQAGVRLMQIVEPPAGKLIPLDITSDLDPHDKVNICLDYYAGRECHLTRNEIKKAVKEFNETVMKKNGYGCMNDLYLCFHKPDELCEVGFGALLGWNYSRDGEVIPMVTSEFDKYGNPCMVLDFYNPPQYDFNK